MKSVLQRTALAAAFLAAISVFAGCGNMEGGRQNLPTKEYMVTVIFDNMKGSVMTVPGIPTSKKVKENTEITFTATPNPGFAIDMWSISKEKFLAGGKPGDKTAKVKVTSDITVTVTFKTSSALGPHPETDKNPDGEDTSPKDPTPDPKKHTVTITQTAHGSVSAHPTLPTDNKVKEGDTITFTATPDQHYLVGEWDITGGTKLEGGAKGDTTAKVKVTSDVTVTVTFKGTHYNPKTGEGAINGSPFTMKQIEAVTDGKLGHDRLADADNKEHTVSLTAYKIGETEVTQDVFEAVMGTNPSHFNGEDKKRYPVENVNWYQAIAFCNKLSLELGLDPCYDVVNKNNNPIDFKTLSFDDIPTTADSDWDKVAMDMNKNGFRLPTEAEWEWAAKGNTENQWPGTNDRNQLHNYAWHTANSGQKTHEVKTRKPNEYQLYDMSGNVLEWCWDGYDEKTPQGGKDPTGCQPEKIVDRQHIVRGGHWSSMDGAADRLTREVNKPEKTIRDGNGQIGFRCVCRN